MNSKNKKIYSIDDLPSFSPWPARLLGLTVYSRDKKRNREENEREYGKEKWGELLTKTQRMNGKIGIDVLDKMFLGNKDILYYHSDIFSKNNILYAHKQYLDIVMKVLSKYLNNKSSLVELGCGYGSIIINLIKQFSKNENKFYAAELTNSGQKLVKIAAKNENVKIKSGFCDITQPKIIDMQVPMGGIIFSSYVTSCIPKINISFIDAILKLKPSKVIHFEPLYEHCSGNSLFEMMRRKYIEINDYNTNYLSILKSSEKQNKIRIIYEKPSVFGLNPLFCASIIVFEPVSNK